ncbi:hypothetical protein ACFOGI_08840 [Virgibacillus xinjiangensis]|uniref:Uncharacterized protein n=1 Tax=Virgibacillus xinjiangensis TaxID=393090 RepID=A0ABV7CVJ2_9BACI
MKRLESANSRGAIHAGNGLMIAGTLSTPSDEIHAVGYSKMIGGINDDQSGL